MGSKFPFAGRQVFGRSSELVQIEGSLDQAQAGSIVLLVGDAGIGKSTLWNETISRLDRRFRVLATRAVEAERRFAYGGLTDLLAGVPEDAASALPIPQREALDIALLRVEPHSPPDPRLVSTATLTLLRRLALDDPVLVCVDDLHWLDPATATALAFALRRVHPNERVCLFGALRRDLGVPAPLAAIAKDAVRLPVQALPFEATALVLARASAGEIGRARAREIWAASGGNPFYALELWRASLLEPNNATATLRVPAELHVLVVDRLRTLPPPAQQALLVAALLADPSRSAVERAVGERAGEAIGLALASEMLQERTGRLEFAHPLFAVAVQRAATPETLRETHRRLASIVDQPEQRAVHLARGSREPDEAVAAALERAAVSAFSRGAPISAVEFAEEALEQTPDGDTAALAGRGLLAGRYRLLLGDQARGIELLTTALDRSPDPRRRAEILVQIAEGVSHDVARAYAAIEEAVQLADGDPTLLARAYGLQAGLDLLRLEQLDEAELRAKKALTYAKAADDPRVLLQTFGYRALVLALRGDDPTAVVDEAAALVPLVDQPTLFWLPERALLHWRLRRGEHASARPRLVALHQHAKELGQEEAVSAYAFHLADLETAAGNWETAQAFADELTEFAAWAPPAQPVATSTDARLAAWRGDTGRARGLAESGIEIARALGSPLFEIQNRAALALAAVSDGDDEGAAAAAAPAWQQVPAEQHFDPAMFPFLPEYVEALVGLGDVDQASAAVAWLEKESQRTRHPWGSLVAARCRGILTAASGDIEGADAAFNAAESSAFGIVLPAEDARTQLAHGIALRRANRRSDARKRLQDAASRFDELGARGFAARAREELSRVSGRIRTSDPLTPAQRKVAELAASGLSNREIGARLHLSENTVETHLRHIFRSLDIKSRVQLARHPALETSSGTRLDPGAGDRAREAPPT